ncbi:DUF4913 domain-containing protein [Nonomuraea sp. NPDC049400]|uniref:DUF4913 domain-containing protein n=1 Tax=Nonomuraea sp. NPDC049400 TaxID=3364352 RepID=UPI0037ADF130
MCRCRTALSAKTSLVNANDHLLVPTHTREPSPTAPWCLRWWEHEEAVARLHDLILAWQELTDPEAGCWTGPTSWHRDHLDPALRELRSPDGPLWRYMTALDKAEAHRPDVPLLSGASLFPNPAGFASV